MTAGAKGIAFMFLHACTHRTIVVRLQWRHVGYQRRRRNAEENAQNRFSANDRRRAVLKGSRRQEASLPQQSSASVVLESESLKFTSLNLGNSVVLRERPINKGIVRRP